MGSIDADALRPAHTWSVSGVVAIFKILGTGPLLGQALQNSWDKPALGTGPSKFLGQARSWDMPEVLYIEW